MSVCLYVYGNMSSKQTKTNTRNCTISDDGANLFNVIHAYSQNIVIIHIVFQIFRLKCDVCVLAAECWIDFLATLSIRLQYETKSARTIKRSIGIMTHLIAWLFAGALVNIKLTMAACVACWARALFRFYTFAIVLAWSLTNCCIITDGVEQKETERGRERNNCRPIEFNRLKITMQNEFIININQAKIASKTGSRFVHPIDSLCTFIQPGQHV